jgi:hypothetical protein
MIFESANAAATVLGTKIALDVEEDETRLDVEEGLVELMRKDDGAKVPVPAGFFAEAARHKPLAARPIDSSRQMGALKIPLQMPLDGKATVALYTKEGRLVRILGQLLILKKGEYTAQWDGMDLWGNLLPEGTEIVCRLFANPGIRAFYEMSVGRGDRDGPAWLTRPIGEGMDMRTGGWLGDHTGPGAAAAFGDKVFLGCTVAEQGHSLIAVDLEGNKLWGGGLAGWGGPSELKAGSKAVLGRNKKAFYRIDPQTYERKRIFDVGHDRLLAWAVHGDEIQLVTELKQFQASPFSYSVSSKNIDFAASVPQMLGTNAPDWQISAQARFATVFNRGGHFQTGITSIVEKSGDAAITAVFKEPNPIGTIVFGSLGKDVKRAEIWALKPGRTLKTGPDIKAAEPAAGAPEDLEDEAELDIEKPGLGGDWTLVGGTELKHRVNYLPVPRADFKTLALKVVLHRSGNTSNRKGPTVKMCRVMRNRVERLNAPARLILPGDADVSLKKDASKKRSRADGIAWKFRSAKPTSDVSPADVIIDLGRPEDVDGLAFLNIANPLFTVYVLRNDTDPEAAEEGQWKEVTSYRARYSKKYRWSTASTHTNERYVVFPERVSARAVRLRFTAGHLSGKNGLHRTKDDPYRFDCEDLALLRLLQKRPDTKQQLRYVWQTRDAETGKLKDSARGRQLEVSHMAFDESGTLFTISENRLCKTKFQGDHFEHTVLNEAEIKRPYDLVSYKDRLVVCDGERDAVLFFDRSGKLVSQIGNGPHTRGAWDKERVDKPSAVTIDKNGKVWVCESSYQPKRVARFSMDGTCEKEFFGPPEYGGGGFLDPDLKSFYYRGMEFDIDWENGTSRLKAHNDRIYTDETPALESNTFRYTRIGYPIEFHDRKYITGSGVVSLKDGDVWKPCAVMGNAHQSIFLLKKAWRDHWKKLNLAGKAFIWCDQNGDGKYQVSEVDLFDPKETDGYPFTWQQWGSVPGPDLTFWSKSHRITPSRITKDGVPIYERTNIRRAAYDLQVFHANITVGMRAKPHYGGFIWIAADGSSVREGQPFVMKPDGTYLGGRPATKPTNYLPRIKGKVIEQPLNYVGGAITESPAGEVAVINGNNGVWSLVSVQDRVLLGQIFTGADGGWSTDLIEKRGTDVTGRRHGGETFHGNFIKAYNGNYYTVAGKGFHGVCRIEGLDDYQVTTSPVKVTAESLAANTALRGILIRQEKAWALGEKRRRSGRELEIRQIDRRVQTGQIKIDGDPSEWGKGLQPIDEPFGPDDPPARLHFDAAHSDEGLAIVWRGYSRTGNQCDDPKFIFKNGFCFDFQYRTGSSRSRDVQKGDRRIAFGKYKGNWIAVMYDHIDPKADPADYTKFASPVVTTSVAKVTVIPENAYRLKVMDENLEVVSRQKAIPGYNGWSAEVFLPWRTLGMKRPKELRCDTGVMNADSGGITVQNRNYWSNPSAHVNDLGVEAAINPGKWGKLRLK